MENCIKSIQLLRDVLSNCCVVMVGASQTIVEVDTAVLPAVVLDAARENPDVYSDCVLRDKQPLSRFRFIFSNRVLISEFVRCEDSKYNSLLFMVEVQRFKDKSKGCIRNYVKKKVKEV